MVCLSIVCQACCITRALYPDSGHNVGLNAYCQVSFALCLSISLHQWILEITNDLATLPLRVRTVGQGLRQKQWLGF